MRKLARECAFKLLYSYQFTGMVDDDFKKSLYLESGLNEEAMNFADKLLNTALEHYVELAEEISSFAIGFDKDRIFKTDKAALILAAGEMKYIKDIPAVVSIDEAVNIAKKYSTENSLSFINGILAKYKNKLEKTND